MIIQPDMRKLLIAVVAVLFSVSTADQFEEVAFDISLETNLCENSGTNGNFHVEVYFADNQGDKFQLQFELFDNDDDVLDQFQNGNIGKFTTIINGTSISGGNLQFVVLHLDDCSDSWLPARITLKHYNWEFEWLNDEPCDTGNSYWVKCDVPLIVFDHRYEEVEERANTTSRTVDEL